MTLHRRPQILPVRALRRFAGLLTGSPLWSYANVIGTEADALLPRQAAVGWKAVAGDESRPLP